MMAEGIPHLYQCMQVEIQAKVAAGYWSSKGVVTADDLTKTVGRSVSLIVSLVFNGRSTAS